MASLAVRPPVGGDDGRVQWREIDERLAKLLEGDAAGVRAAPRVGSAAEAGPCPKCGHTRLWHPKSNPNEIRCGRCQEPQKPEEVASWFEAVTGDQPAAEEKETI